MTKYPALEVKRKSGKEVFHIEGKPLDQNLLSFWQWSSSDLISNAMRGILAEYIVASALGENYSHRSEWDAYDIETKEGIKIEVKSSAFIQTWHQKSLSSIQFSIRPTISWGAQTNSRSTKIVRQADVYVFCLLTHKEQDTIDPLNVNQWLFYILSSDELNQSVGAQKTIVLSSLLRLNPITATYLELPSAIEKSANKAVKNRP
ncbi:hypothetical protein [Psychrobacter sp. W2-37-MNA-CIBAN-0211]|jgi:hypothetical protein|uniref:hypothetical protein n=1 Tax=Psychrobacter sp. W2-37-MNA-CIBAN-0211 TaxID=3140443 RepID=UPI00331ED82C